MKYQGSLIPMGKDYSAVAFLVGESLEGQVVVATEGNSAGMRILLACYLGGVK